MSIKHTPITGRLITPDDYNNDAHILDGTPGMLLAADGGEIDPDSLVVTSVSAGEALLFTNANGWAVDPAVTAVNTSGWSAPGIGGGRYIYDAAVVAADGVSTFLAADGRGFKLDPTARLTVENFGPVSTAAERSATLRAATDYRLYPTAIKYGSEVTIPPAGMTLSETLEPNGVFSLKGIGISRHPGSAGVMPSILTGPIDQTTIRLRSSGTDGMGLLPGTNSAAESRIANVTITQPTGTNYAAHGVQARSTLVMRDVMLTNIAGDGIVIAASYAGDDDTVGNANQWYLEHCSIHTARGNGVCIGSLNGEVAAADVNAGLALHLYIHNVKRVGIVDHSFYANTFVAPQVNGSGNGGVHHAGQKWMLIVLSNTGTEPGTDPAVWYGLDFLAAPNADFVAWDALTTFYAETQILSHTGTFITPYAENQKTLSHNPMGIIIAGNMEWTQHSNKIIVYDDVGITNNRGIGHYRTTSGVGALHPAWTQIGILEETTIGKPEAGVYTDLHTRAMILYHRVDTNYFVMKYENADGSGVKRDIMARSGTTTAANELFCISGIGTAKTFGRSTTLEGHFILFDHGIQSPFDTNALRVHGMRSSVPTTFNQATGERYWNTAVASADLDAWVCTVAGTTTTAGTFAKDYLNQRSSPTKGIGYVTLAGGAVTQATSRTTTVVLNNVCGAITLVSAAGSATWQTFTVTNSTVAATDVIKVCQKSGTDLNMIHVTNVAAGSFKISFATTGGTTTEQPVFNFAVIKAVAA